MEPDVSTFFSAYTIGFPAQPATITDASKADPSEMLQLVRAEMSELRSDVRQLVGKPAKSLAAELSVLPPVDEMIRRANALLDKAEARFINNDDSANALSTVYEVMAMLRALRNENPDMLIRNVVHRDIVFQRCNQLADEIKRSTKVS